MLPVVDLARHTLAALYLAYVMTSTKGPYAVFTNARQSLPHGGLLTCFFCLVLWVSIGLRLMPRALVDAAAVAGGASALYKYSGLGYE